MFETTASKYDELEFIENIEKVYATMRLESCSQQKWCRSHQICAQLFRANRWLWLISGKRTHNMKLKPRCWHAFAIRVLFHWLRINCVSTSCVVDTIAYSKFLNLFLVYCWESESTWKEDNNKEINTMRINRWNCMPLLSCTQYKHACNWFFDFSVFIDFWNLSSIFAVNLNAFSFFVFNIQKTTCFDTHRIIIHCFIWVREMYTNGFLLDQICLFVYLLAQ